MDKENTDSGQQPSQKVLFGEGEVVKNQRRRHPSSQDDEREIVAKPDELTPPVARLPTAIADLQHALYVTADLKAIWLTGAPTGQPAVVIEDVFGGFSQPAKWERFMRLTPAIFAEIREQMDVIGAEPIPADRKKALIERWQFIRDWVAAEGWPL